MAYESPINASTPLIEIIVLILSKCHWINDSNYKNIVGDFISSVYTKSQLK